GLTGCATGMLSTAVPISETGRLRRGRGRRRGRRDDAELRQHAQVVLIAPVLDHLAALEAQDVDAGDGEWLVGGRDAQASPLVRALYGRADHHLVALGDGVVDGELQVGERLVEQGDDLLEALAAG